MNKGRLIVLSGPSGCGKNTVFEGLKAINPDIAHTVSVTTRAPRENEVHGVDYYYVSKEEFLRRIEADEFVEYVNYGENFYGTLKSVIERLISDGKIVIMVIEVRGAVNIKKAFPGALSIFLLPPSMEVLSERLRGRGTNSEEDVQLRLDIAKDEIGYKDLYDYNVINDDLDKCIEQVNAIINKND